MSSARAGAVGGSLLLATMVSGACGGIESPNLDQPASGGSSAGRGGRGGSPGASASAGRGGAAILPSPDAGVGGRAGSAGTNAPPDAGVVRTPPPAPREHCDAIEEVFRFKCGPSCHQNVGFANGDFAVGPEEARNYVDRVSARGSRCGLVIDSQDPQNSLILTKITGDYPPDSCGGAMPIGSFEITDGEIDCISDWVEQFAR